MTRDRPISVGLLGAEAAPTPGSSTQLTDLINDVYATAERGLWRDGRDPHDGDRAGRADPRAGRSPSPPGTGTSSAASASTTSPRDTGEFGMLVAAPDQRGTGVGRALVDFAEQRSRERGLRTMQLELLVPREWPHPSKEFLKAWYGRIGYRLVRTGNLDDTYPQLAPLLATPCDLEIHEKPL